MPILKNQNVKIFTQEIINSLGKNYQPNSIIALPSNQSESMTQHEFVNECAKIATLFTDFNLCLEALKIIENKMAKKIEGNNHQVSVKLLRETIEEILGDAAFYPKLGKTTGYVDSTMFLSSVSQGLLIKDKAAGFLPHGEFTHALQWCMILVLNQTKPFLTYQPIDIFKIIGSSWGNFETKIRANENIWDYLVDEADNTSPSVGLRCPDNVNKFVFYKSTDLPIMSKLIQMRFDKRLHRTTANKTTSDKQPKPKLNKSSYNESDNEIMTPTGFDNSAFKLKK